MSGRNDIACVEPAAHRLYQLWLESWNAALTALAAVDRTGAFRPHDLAAHRAVLAGERAAVSRLLNGGFDGG